MLQTFFNNVKDTEQLIGSTKFRKVSKKLITLIQLKQSEVHQGVTIFSNFIFHERVKNLSNVSFTEDEMGFMNLGLKFALNNVTDQSLTNFAIDLDVLIERITPDSNIKNLIRNQCAGVIAKLKNKHWFPNFDKKYSRIIKSISSKVKDNNLIITKADKGSCLVILDKIDYINKVETFLSQNNFTIVANNPLPKFVNLTKQYIKTCLDLFTLYNKKYNLIPSNPMMPRLYGLPKIHKPGVPIRPVVSFCNTPVCFISKFILNIIKSLTNFSPSNTVKNNTDLANRIKNLHIPDNYLMISLDVTNLFTTVPIAETLPLVADLLSANNVQFSIKTNILTLLKFCLSQNFFVFNNQFYSQPDGLAMGSTLSPFLADLFMDHFENNFILNKFDVIKHYFRYVDDCLVFIQGDTEVATDMLNRINSLHSKIKFTLEVELNRKINYLDLTISIINNSLEFEIFRKPTQTDHTIPSFSNHHISHKLAAFNCYINRMLNIPLSTVNFTKELNIVKQLAVNNGYESGLIDKLLMRIQYKRTRQLAFSSISSSDLSNQYCSLPFLNNFLSQQITSIFRNNITNVKISFSNNNTSSKILINNKDKIDILNKSGVYKLCCNDCEATYIGRTIRPLNIRIKEHLVRPNSAFGHHLKFNNHNFSPSSNSKIIHNLSSCSYLKFELSEEMEITKEMIDNPLCLNNQINFNKNFVPLYNIFIH